MSDIAEIAPKSWRPMILAGSLLVAGGGAAIWATSFVRKAATEASAPLQQRVEDHEREDDQKWAQMQNELDTIQRDVNDEKEATVYLANWVKKQEQDENYAGARRRHP